MIEVFSVVALVVDFCPLPVRYTLASRPSWRKSLLHLNRDFGEDVAWCLERVFV